MAAWLYSSDNTVLRAWLNASFRRTCLLKWNHRSINSYDISGPSFHELLFINIGAARSLRLDRANRRKSRCNISDVIDFRMSLRCSTKSGSDPDCRNASKCYLQLMMIYIFLLDGSLPFNKQINKRLPRGGLCFFGCVFIHNRN